MCKSCESKSQVSYSKKSSDCGSAKKYDYWKDECKTDGDVRGKKKCYLICEYKYEQDYNKTKYWGHRERKDYGWQSVKADCQSAGWSGTSKH